MLRAKIDNQDGMVLVLVLLVLLASTLIGVASLRSATTDVRIIGNDARFSKDLYTAEANINTAIWETRYWVDEPSAYPKCNGKDKTYEDKSLNLANDIEIVSNGKGQPPRGSGYSVTAFRAGYYNITSKCGNASVESGAWMIEPKIN